MIYHRCSRCGKRIPTGQKCDCIKVRHKEYDRSGRNEEARAFYHSRPWVMTRQLILDRYDGMDVYELYVNHRVRHADTVHHIIPREDDTSKALDLDNLIPVSSYTHRLIHAAYAKGQDEKMRMQKILREAIEDF